MSSRKPKKPQTGTSPSHKSSAKAKTSAASPIAASSANSSIASPKTSKTTLDPKAPDYFGFECSVCSISDHETMPAPKRQRPDNTVIETVKEEEALKPMAAESFFELPVVSPPDPRIRALRTSPPKEYDYADYESEVSMSILDFENQI